MACNSSGTDNTSSGIESDNANMTTTVSWNLFPCMSFFFSCSTLFYNTGVKVSFCIDWGGVEGVAPFGGGSDDVSLGVVLGMRLFIHQTVWWNVLQLFSRVCTEGVALCWVWYSKSLWWMAVHLGDKTSITSGVNIHMTLTTNARFPRIGKISPCVLFSRGCALCLSWNGR